MKRHLPAAIGNRWPPTSRVPASQPLMSRPADGEWPSEMKTQLTGPSDPWCQQMSATDVDRLLKWLSKLCAISEHGRPSPNHSIAHWWDVVALRKRHLNTMRPNNLQLISHSVASKRDLNWRLVLFIGYKTVLRSDRVRPPPQLVSGERRMLNGLRLLSL